jgi:glutamate formiminotransferase / 5-formyltetrahydrofolate cyclo-ligase
MIRILRAGGASVLDVHSDAIHHRSVFTLTAPADSLRTALTRLAQLTAEIGLSHHDGVHPRLGGLDVCPIVPLDTSMDGAVALAHLVGASIHRATGLPIYFYGEASSREQTRELRDLRRGGLSRLVQRAAGPLPPDIGGPIDLEHGVVCVGARRPLIAFNVRIEADLTRATEIAKSVRETEGGLRGVRALAFPLDSGVSQVSMNLTEPASAGIDRVFDSIAERADRSSVRIIGCEVVGLVPERFLPDPTKQAARLLEQPDLCLEKKIRSSSS